MSLSVVIKLYLKLHPALNRYSFSSLHTIGSSLFWEVAERGLAVVHPSHHSALCQILLSDSSLFLEIAERSLSVIYLMLHTNTAGSSLYWEVTRRGLSVEHILLLPNTSGSSLFWEVAWREACQKYI